MATPPHLFSSVRASRRTFLRAMLGFSAGAAVRAFASEGKDNQPNSGTPPVIDTHMHVWAGDPKQFPFTHPYDPDYTVPVHPATVEMLVDDMDREGCTHSVLIQVIFHGWDNSYVAHCVRLYPERFKAHGLIDPTDPNVAQKLEYWMLEHGLAGMRFSPIYYLDNDRDSWLTSPAHHALWKKAAQLDAVFNFFIATQQLPKLEYMVQRYPEVPIAIDHISQIDLGAPNPAPELQKLLAFARYPNVWVKISELSSVSKSGQYPFPDAYPWVEQVYDAFGPDRLLWGTGYPGSARAHYKRPTLRQELDLIRHKIPFFTPEDQEKILGRNAAALWGFAT